MHLSGLRLYPLKGAAGRAAARVRLDPRGVVGDRRWVIYGRDGRFVSQRDVPRLALVTAELVGEQLRLGAPGRAMLEVAPSGPETQVTVWDDTVAALDCGDAAAAWLTATLGREARLGVLPADAERQVDLAYAKPGDQVGYADGFPLLVANEASLVDLNARLAAPVPMDRFRPNVVIAGAPPFAEDGWRRLRVGAVELDLVKPCARCAVITVDQATGVRGKEPLATLASFRTVDGKVLFGVNAIHRGGGELAVGDPVEVLA